MGRIRSIKPEFWTSLDVTNLSRDARLLFIGLWNYVDDHGRGVADARLIKAAVFPTDDDLDSTNVRRLLDELSRGRQIILYEVAGRPHLQVTNWHHQKIDRPSRSKLPEPPGAPSGLDEYDFDEPSTNPRRDDDEGSCPDQGIKGSREQGTDVEPAAPARPQAGPTKTDIATVFTTWQTATGHTKAFLDKKRAATIAKAIVSHGLDDTLDAARGIACSPYHLGENETRTRYDDIGLVLRDAAHIEKFRDMYRQSIGQAPVPTAAGPARQEIGTITSTAACNMARNYATNGLDISDLDEALQAARPAIREAALNEFRKARGAA